jgi:hypothetical protein
MGRAGEEGEQEHTLSLSPHGTPEDVWHRGVI